MMKTSIFNQIRLKAANILNPSINRLMQRVIFQWIGSNNGIVSPDNKQSYIDNGYNKNLFVYMCVNYITRNASAIPWVLKRELPDGSLQQVNKHELYDVLERPNGLYSFKEYVQQSLGYLLLTGDSMTYSVKVNGGKLKEVYYLPSNYMEIVASGNWMEPIKRYDFSLFQDVSFENDEIIHAKLPSYEWDNGQSLWGQSPLKAGLSTLDRSNETINAMKSQAANQGAKGLLMYDGQANGNISGLNDTQEQNIRTQVNKKLNSSDKAGSIQITAKMFKYQNLGVPSKDLQLLESHGVSKQDICALYSLDSMLFNDHVNSSYNNMSEAKKSAYVDAIIPYLQILMDDWNNSIVRAYDKNLAFYPDTSNIEVLQDNKKEQAEWLSGAYWISTQRKQEIMGEKADNSLPAYLIPANLIPSDDLGMLENPDGDYTQPTGE